MENKRLIKDRIFSAIVKAIFYVIYGYFDPPGTSSAFELAIHHYTKKKTGEPSKNNHGTETYKGRPEN